MCIDKYVIKNEMSLHLRGLFSFLQEVFTGDTGDAGDDFNNAGKIANF